MPVTEIKNIEEFKAQIGKSTPVIIDFYATWCGPCKVISPIFEKLSNENSGAEFFKVDVDAVPDAAQEVGIRAMPTFMAFKDGAKVGEVIGAKPSDLTSLVQANLA